MRSHPFIASPDKIAELAFMVLASVYGQEEICKLAPPDGRHEAFTQIAGIGEGIFENSMVALAAMARANSEGIDSLGIHADRNPKGVGLLTKGKDTTPLTAKEACNKIIHAKDAEIYWKTENTHPLYQEIYDKKFGKLEQEYCLPYLKLNGEQHGKEWEATVSLILWIQAVVFFT